MRCEHWKAWENSRVMGYCTIRKDVTGVDLACNYRAERPEECVIWLTSEIARLHEANDGWREAHGKIEERLRELARGVTYVGRSASYEAMGLRLQAILPEAQAILAVEVAEREAREQPALAGEEGDDE